MKHWHAVVLLLLAASAVAGCSKSGAEEKDENVATSNEPLGVAECDDYMQRMSDCIDKMPSEGRTVHETGLKKTREAWREALKAPNGKETLKAVCQTALREVANGPACK